jgi:hypothetical protein
MIFTASPRARRHLHEGINPAPFGEIPPVGKELFSDILEQDNLDYRKLMKDIQASGEVGLRY